MTTYLVNKQAQSTGEHEVHQDTCRHLPDIANRQYLGVFSNCKEALVAAKKQYSNVDGCYYCCNECNKK